MYTQLDGSMDRGRPLLNETKYENIRERKKKISGLEDPFRRHLS